MAVSIHSSFLTRKDSTWLEAVALLVLPRQRNTQKIAWSIACFTMCCDLCKWKHFHLRVLRSWPMFHQMRHKIIGTAITMPNLGLVVFILIIVIIFFFFQNAIPVDDFLGEDCQTIWSSDWLKMSWSILKLWQLNSTLTHFYTHGVNN